LGRPAKPLPAAKADLESLFEFSRWEKILNASQWIHPHLRWRSGGLWCFDARRSLGEVGCGFFPISKTEYQLNLHFLATGNFACLPLGSFQVIGDGAPAQEQMLRDTLWWLACVEQQYALSSIWAARIALALLLRVIYSEITRAGVREQN
jgi:hypothetical protein